MKIIYLGSDTEYWKNLQEKYQEYFPDIEYEFIKVWCDKLETFHQVICEINNHKPNVVLLDYSHLPLKVLTVARNLTRVMFKTRAFIGLWSATADDHLIAESNTTGVPINHIKGVEFGEIIAHSMYLDQESDGVLREFAKADLQKEPLKIEATHQMRVGFVGPEYMHVEHDLIPNQQLGFQLTCHFKPNLPKKFKLERKINENFYYNYKYSSDFNFLFEPIEEEEEEEVIVDTEGEESVQTKKKKKKSIWEEAEIAEEKEKVANFFEAYEETNYPKRTKLLIIDKKLRIFKKAPMPLDNYPYSIRVYPSVDEEGKVVKKMKAGIVCYSCPEGKEGILGRVIASIKMIEGYEPFLFVFNSSWSAEYLQNHYSYPRILSSNGDFEWEGLLKFCESYDESDGRDKSHDKSKSFHHQEERIYIDKNKPESYVEYKFDIDVTEVSETHFTFSCKEFLPLWSTYKISDPMKLYMTIAKEVSRTDEEGTYMAFLHGIGELDRAKLRTIVNKVIYDSQNKS